MKERPIIFSSDMIKAILDGRKTMTRRPVKPQPEWLQAGEYNVFYPRWKNKDYGNLKQLAEYCPYGQAGDRLWVRETYCIESNMGIAGNEEYPPPFNDGRPVQHHMDLDWGSFWDQCHYKATDPTPELAYEDTDQPTVRWKPSIHMPRHASRITLEIVKVRVERLQEITPMDCISEGIQRSTMLNVRDRASEEITRFKNVWNSLYTKKPELQWEANNWVWVVEFIKCPTNADISDKEKRG